MAKFGNKKAIYKNKDMFWIVKRCKEFTLDTGTKKMSYIYVDGVFRGTVEGEDDFTIGNLPYESHIIMCSTKVLDLNTIGTILLHDKKLLTELDKTNTKKLGLLMPFFGGGYGS